MINDSTGRIRVSRQPASAVTTPPASVAAAVKIARVAPNPATIRRRCSAG
jgi:hypothetical protein